MFKPGKKVMAIGLDSASPELIERWVDEGKLPVFRRLMETGCYGRISSTVPALTPPAWTTAMTGVNPGKHNVYDFFKIQPDHKKEVVNAGDRRSKAIWNLLNDSGGRSIILNLPITYPAEQFNGVMVTGMPTPTVKKDFVSPENLLEEVLDLTGGRQLAVDIHTLLRGDEAAFLKDLEVVTERITKLTRHFIEKEEWDFLMVVFDDLDRIQHTFWHHMDPDHPLFDKNKAELYQDAILTFYQYLERQIETLLSGVDDDTLIMVFSDHGMGPIYRNFHINRFFEEQGWLKIKHKIVKPKEILRFLGLSQERIRLFLSVMKLRSIARRMIPAKIKNRVKQYLPAEAMELEFFDWSNLLDWENSKAYLCSRTGQSIMINKNNVEDYEAFRETVIASLLELKDPETGKSVIENAYKKESVFQGPHMDHAPDILIETAELYELQEKPGEAVFADIKPGRVPISANHRQEGILFLSNSQAVRKGCRLSGVAMADIAPTVLYGLGLSVPRDMDGRVLVDAFNQLFLENHPVNYNDISLTLDGTLNSISPSDAEKITDRLKGLGYMD